MLAEEAVWIREQIRDVRLDARSVVVDVGSSTAWMRSVYQPYIDYELFAPLRASGVRIVHVDALNEEGVDVVADVTAADELPPDLHGVADLVLCTNLLEHVKARDVVLSQLRTIARPSGTLVLTVPHRYPYHPDPIDTKYRPAPEELGSEVSRFFTVRTTSLISASPRPFELQDGPAWRVACEAARLVAFKLRRDLRPAYRMPRTCLVSGVVGVLPPDQTAQK